MVTNVNYFTLVNDLVVKNLKKELGIISYTSLWRRTFGAPRGLAPMAQYYNSQLRSSLRSLLARRTFGTPKDNGIDASIDIFLVASLEYHLI